MTAIPPRPQEAENPRPNLLKTPAPHPKTRGHGPIKGDGG